MIILFEGVDKTGKTTLSTRLATEYPRFEYRKHSTMRSSIDALTACHNVLSEIKSTKNYIFDRFYCPSDLVYGPIVGGYKISGWVSSQYREKIIPWMLEHTVIVVLCSADKHTLAERFVRDQEEYANDTQICDLAIAYEQLILYQKLFPYVIHIDSTETDSEEMYRQLLDGLRNMGAI